MAWDDTRARAALRAMFDAAVAAADPRAVLAAPSAAEARAGAASWWAAASRPR